MTYREHFEKLCLLYSYGYLNWCELKKALKKLNTAYKGGEYVSYPHRRIP